METLRRIENMRTKMILDYPFYARVAMMLKLELDPEIKTAGTDGNVIKFNPEFVDPLLDNNLKGLIAHEVLHVAHLHNFRRHHRDQKRWNIVCDYSINGILKKAGFSLPEGGVYDAKFEDFSPEKIYGMFCDDADDQKYDDCGEVEDNPGNQEQQGDGSGEVDEQQEQQNSGGGNDGQDEQQEQQEPSEEQGNSPDSMSAGQRNRMDEIKTAVMQQAALEAKAGRGAGSAESAVKAMQAKVDWKKELEEFFQSTVQDDFSWSKPDRRFLNAFYGDPALILPSLDSEGMQEIGFILDTSCSVDDEILDQFWSECVKIAQDAKCKIHVFQVDHDLQDYQEYSHEELPSKLAIHGRGGTRFDPAFDLIEALSLDLDCAIYLTDMEAEPPRSIPDYPVLWASSNNYDSHWNDGFPSWFGKYKHSRIIEVFAY